MALLCIEIEASLRRQGLETGIDGPSFDCGKAFTPTERVLCADKDLWAKDLRRAMLIVQRKWLAVRNRCAADLRCLNNVYDQRLQELKLIKIDS